MTTDAEMRELSKKVFQRILLFALFKAALYIAIAKAAKKFR